MDQAALVLRQKYMAIQTAKEASHFFFPAGMAQISEKKEGNKGLLTFVPGNPGKPGSP